MPMCLCVRYFQQDPPWVPYTQPRVSMASDWFCKISSVILFLIPKWLFLATLAVNLRPEDLSTVLFKSHFNFAQSTVAKPCHRHQHYLLSSQPLPVSWQNHKEGCVKVPSRGNSWGRAPRFSKSMKGQVGQASLITCPWVSSARHFLVQSISRAMQSLFTHFSWYFSLTFF